MMNFIKNSKFWLVVMLLLLPLNCMVAKPVTKNGVTIDYIVRSDGTIYVKSAENKSGGIVEIRIDGKTAAVLKQNESKSINEVGSNTLKSVKTQGDKHTPFWRYTAPAAPKHEEESSCRNVSKGGVLVDCLIRDDGTIYVKSAKNESEEVVTIRIDGRIAAELKRNETKTINKDAYRTLKSAPKRGGKCTVLWRYNAPASSEHEGKQASSRNPQ